MRVVQKYGGSSVATIEQIESIANFLKQQYLKGYQLVVVVSAMGKTTDHLIGLAKSVASEPNKRELDVLLSTGETQSVALLAMALNQIGVKSVSLMGFQAGFTTNDEFSRAFITDLDTKRVEKELEDGKIVIVTGFQGITKNSDITTFGRGGSDTTAVALASKLKCPCEIYTDVESVFSVDPRIYPNAKKRNKLSYEEMMEMAVGGAKVLEPRCIELAKKFGVQLYLGKTLEIDKSKGTRVMDNEKYFEEMPVTSLSIKNEVSILKIRSDIANKQLISEIFKILVESKINYEMLCLNEFYKKFVFSFSSSELDIKRIEDVLQNSNFAELIEIEKSENLSKIMLVGLGFSTHTRIASKVFELLTLNNIEYSLISISEISISFIVKESSKDEAVRLLAERFNL